MTFPGLNPIGWRQCSVLQNKTNSLSFFFFAIIYVMEKPRLQSTDNVAIMGFLLMRLMTDEVWSKWSVTIIIRLYTVKDRLTWIS